MPHSCAFSADRSSPSKAKPLARARPTKFGTSQLAPTSGIMPNWGAKTRRNLALSAASTKSLDSARPTPPPAATPLIAVITGLGLSTTARTSGLKPISIELAVISPGVMPFSLGQLPPARSAPAQKPRPLPVSTMARTLSSSAALLNASISAKTISLFRLFKTSGRFIRSVKTPLSLTSFSKISDMLTLPQSLFEQHLKEMAAIGKCDII